MRLFPALVVALAASEATGQESPSSAPQNFFPSGGPHSVGPSGGPHSGCQDSVEDITNDLIDAFGEGNCVETLNNVADDGESYTQLDCSFEVVDYTASAVYRYPSENSGVSSELTVTSTYLEPLNSFLVLIDFVEECFDTVDSLLFSTIKPNRLERDCSNSSEEIFYIPIKGNPNKNQKAVKASKTRKTDCEKVGKFNAFRMRRVCNKYSEVSEACKGICKTGDFCRCEQNPFAFPLRNGSTQTCDEFEELDEAIITRKCNRLKFRQNCPAVCGCTLEDTSWTIRDGLDDSNIILR